LQANVFLVAQGSVQRIEQQHFGGGGLRELRIVAVHAWQQFWYRSRLDRIRGAEIFEDDTEITKAPLRG